MWVPGVVGSKSSFNIICLGKTIHNSMGNVLHINWQVAWKKTQIYEDSTKPNIKGIMTCDCLASMKRLYKLTYIHFCIDHDNIRYVQIVDHIYPLSTHYLPIIYPLFTYYLLIIYPLSVMIRHCIVTVIKPTQLSAGCIWKKHSCHYYLNVSSYIYKYIEDKIFVVS